MSPEINDQFVESLAQWSEPVEVQTKYGPRLLRKATVTNEFSIAWRSNREKIKATGAGFSKNLKNEWELTWWKELSTDVLSARKAAIEDSKATNTEETFPAPEGRAYRPYQAAGIKYLRDHPRTLLADEMGLGKTIEVIGTINILPDVRSIVIICPKTLKLNWFNELSAWLLRDLTFAVADGHAWPSTDIVILNYEATGPTRFFDVLHSRHWDLLVLDEAHMVKDNRTQRSIHIMGREENPKKYIEAVAPIIAKRHIYMTGTPLLNKPSEIYNLVKDMHNWGGWFRFHKRYCAAHQTRWGWTFDGSSNLDELQRILRENCMIRRLKADVEKELPAKIRQIIELEPDTEDQRAALAAEHAFSAHKEADLLDLQVAVELSKAESDEAYNRAAARLYEYEKVSFTEIAQLRHDTAVSKVPAVAAHVIDALEQDASKKVIVCAHHLDVIAALMDAFAEYHPVKLTGEMNEAARQDSITKFQTSPDVRVFVAGIKAAGVGITLTASSHVIFAELDWVPAAITQMEDRAHRIGQTQTVLVQHIVLQGSLDARMVQRLIAKQAIFDAALDTNHPERVRPVSTAKHRAASENAKPDELAKIADQLTPEKIQAIRARLSYLSGQDGDFASELNSVGFSKIDTRLGHELAALRSLTPRQAALAFKVLRKYWRQFGDAKPTELTDL